MEAVVSKALLTSKLGMILSVADGKSSAQYTGGVKIIADKSGLLKMQATNTILGIVISIQANVLDDGEVVVPAQLFSDSVSLISSMEISIKKADGRLLISGNNSSFEINYGEADRFPAIYDVPDVNFFCTVDSGELSDSIKRCSRHTILEKIMSSDLLSGVMIDIKEDNMDVVGCDRNRVLICNIDCESSETVRYTIPKSSVGFMSKHLPKNSVVEIYCDGTLWMRFGSDVIYTRLNVGDYPNIRAIIPDDEDISLRCEMSTQSLAQSVGKAKLIFSHAARNNKNALIWMSVSDVDRGILMSAEHSTTGAFSEVVDWVSVERKGEAPSFSRTRFNPNLLHDGISTMSDNSVMVKFQESRPAVVLEGERDVFMLMGQVSV